MSLTALQLLQNSINNNDPGALSGALANERMMKIIADMYAVIAAGSASGVTLNGTETLTNKTLTSPTINSGAVSGTFTGAAVWSGVQTFNNNMVIARTGLIGPGITYGLDFSYTAAPGSTDQAYGLLAKLTLNGSAVPSGAEHGAAVLARFFDGASNRHGGIGVEGKVDALGLASYIGVSGDCGFIGASFAGQALTAFSVTRMSITTDGSTPLASGTSIGIYIPTFVGGAAKLGIFSKESVRVDSTIGAYDASGAKAVNMSHDGTDGTIAVTSGNLNINATAILMSTAGVIPITNGTLLGQNGNRFSASLYSTTNISLAASVTPANNTELVFQATSDTSLTFKYKGSDGTVRSASLTLS